MAERSRIAAGAGGPAVIREMERTRRLFTAYKIAAELGREKAAEKCKLLYERSNAYDNGLPTSWWPERLKLPKADKATELRSISNFLDF